MFLFGKKKQNPPPEGVAYATQSGQTLPLEDMPDPVFAGKILGDGACLLPSDGRVYSPVSGRVDNIADASHAYGLVTNDGADIMVHIGVDTVELKGQGFVPKVKAGQQVAAGDLLCEVDLEAVTAAGYPSHTAVLLTNGDDFIMEHCPAGQAQAGVTPLFTYKKKNGR